MYSDKIYLTPQEILNKEFPIVVRGFPPQEVDKFLDMVIRDYTEFYSIIRNKDKEIRDLTEDNVKLKQEIRKLRTTIEAAEEESETQTRSVSNLDLLRRISQLEKVVFGKNE